MGDIFKKVQNGEKLRIPASTYNAMIDAAQDYARRKANGGMSDPAGAVPVNMVYVKNTTGAAVDRLNVLGLSDTLIAATANSFKQTTAFTGVVPLLASHSGGRFVITAEPIANNSVGRSFVTGYCAIQINVTDTSHTFADVKDNDVTQLNSAASGPVVILWKEAGTGTKWAIVRFGGSGGGGSFSITWAKVIVAPKYADPASFTLSGGIGYYTLRAVALPDYPVWSNGTSYQDGAEVVYPDQNGCVYRSKNGTGTPPVQSGHQPDISPTYWDKLDEIKVEHAMGADGKDVRLFTPWFEVGAIVPVLSREVVGVGTRYYIWATLTYGGTHDQASIRWNETEKRAMACYK